MKYVTIILIVVMLLGGVAISEETKVEQTPTRTGQIVDDGYELIVPYGETYTIHGEHTYTGHVYINGTLEITPYDATPNTKTGTLRLNASNIFVNGIIDGRGRGYGGGGGCGGPGDNGGGGNRGEGGNMGQGGDGGTKAINEAGGGGEGG